MNNRKTPIIRFKGFTDDWEQRKLGEISPLRGGFAFKSEEYADEGIPIIRISNILSDGTVGAEFAYCKEQTDDAAFTLKNGAALLAMSGATTGKVSVLHARNTDKYYQNQRVGYFTQTRDYDYGFVSMMVRSQMFLDQLSAVLVAGAQSNVSSKDIDGFEFMIPMSKVEQEKLGELFFSLDNLITLHQRKLEKLKIVKKAMLENCFPKNGEKVPRFRFSGFTGDWEQRKLGELVDRVVRKNTNNESTLPLTISAQYGLVNQILYFNNRVASRDVSNYYLVLNGEFAYNKSTSDGYPFGAVKRLDLYEKGVLSTLYIVFAPKEDHQIDSDFLTVFFDTDRWYKGVAERASEGARNHGLLNISAENFFDIDLSMPEDIAEQKQIGAIIRNLDHLITLHQRKLEKLKIIKKSFLEKMFV